MAERRAAGFNIPLNFYDGPEVNSIPKRIRAAAIGVWSLAGDYAATQLSDGYVPADVLKTFGCTDAIRAALKVTINKKGDLSPLWLEGRHGGIQLTNWPKHQRTNDEVTAYRTREAERKRVERDAKRSRSTSENEDLSGWTMNGHDADVRTDVRDPKTETKTETRSVVTLGSADKPSATTRGSRLPDAWMPPENVIAQMRSDHPHVNLRSEHEKFIDYWHAQPGAKGRKSDWPAVWRNWIRRAAEQAPARNGTHLKPSTTDARVAQLQAMKTQPTQQNRELE